jgi:hypothetical protein
MPGVSRDTRVVADLRVECGLRYRPWHQARTDRTAADAVRREAWNQWLTFAQ